MIKKTILTCAIPVVLAGCSQQIDLTPWWSFYNLEGFYPLRSSGSYVLMQGHQAFIKSSSIMVDCNGKPLQLSKGTTLFLLKGERVAVYSEKEKRVTVIYHLSELAGLKGLTNGRFLKAYTVNVELDLANTPAANQPQCSKELEFAAKQF